MNNHCVPAGVPLIGAGKLQHQCFPAHNAQPSIINVPDGQGGLKVLQIGGQTRLEVIVTGLLSNKAPLGSIGPLEVQQAFEVAKAIIAESDRLVTTQKPEG